MIKCATIKKKLVKSKNKAHSIKINKPQLKRPLDFDYYIKQLLTEFSEKTSIHENYIKTQQTTIQNLISINDSKNIATFLLEKFTNSRFKAFNLAIKKFSNVISAYLIGEINIESLKDYKDNIPNHADEHWYQEFSDFRYGLINGLISKDKEKSFSECIDILVEAQASKEVDMENEGYFKYLEQCIKLYKMYIIDLLQITWPEKGNTVKLLFGE